MYGKDIVALATRYKHMSNLSSRISPHLHFTPHIAMWTVSLTSLVAGSSVALADLVGLPTLPFTTTTEDCYEILGTHNIVVDSRYANSTDTNGWTLIPPTLHDFAQTFKDDLAEVVGQRTTTALGDGCGIGSIYLTLGNVSSFVDAAGRWTSEAYLLNVTAESITITGASPLGVWWGTRSVLQQAVLNNGRLFVGTGADSPGWNTRGVFVCSYSLLSFLLHGNDPG